MLQHISIYAHHAFHPLFSYADCMSSYLVFLSSNAASILSFHGIASLIIMTCLVAVDHITISGLSIMWTISSWKYVQPFIQVNSYLPITSTTTEGYSLSKGEFELRSAGATLNWSGLPFHCSVKFSDLRIVASSSDFQINISDETAQQRVW